MIKNYLPVDIGMEPHDVHVRVAEATAKFLAESQKIDCYAEDGVIYINRGSEFFEGCEDNRAIIAYVGTHYLKQGEKIGLRLDVPSGDL